MFTRKNRIRLVDLALHLLGYLVPALFLNFMLHMLGVPVLAMAVLDIAYALVMAWTERRS